DLSARRADIPALHQEGRGKQLIYLDNASTTLKPQSVIDAVQRMFARECANIHRGVHALSEAATASYEGARGRIAAFLGVPATEVVLTSGTTASVNLVAQAWGRANVGRGDAIVVSELEHHSNLVPWQMLCRERGASLHVLRVDDGGHIEVDPRAFDAAKLVAVSQVSNVVGTAAPLADIVAAARAAGALVLVDGAQAV